MIYTLVAKDKEDNVVAYFDFDCIRNVELNFSANVSSTPVESAETITDNISYEPNTYSIDAVISSYGIFDSSKEIVYDGNGLRQVSYGGQQPADLKTHLTAREKLMQMFFSRQTVSLIESDRKPLVYNNPQEAYEMQKQGHFVESESCVINSMKISYPDDADDAFYVSMTIQKVLIAKVQVLELTKDEMIPQLTPLVQTPTDVGSTTTTEGSQGSDTTKLPSTNTTETKADAKPSSGRIQDPVYQRATASRLSYAEALTRAASLMSLENRQYTVVQRGAGNWEPVPLDGGTTASRPVMRQY